MRYSLHLWPNRRNSRVLWEIVVQEDDDYVRFQTKSRNKTGSRMRIEIYAILEMWANAQPDGRPAEYRWRPLFNAAKFG